MEYEILCPKTHKELFEKFSTHSFKKSDDSEYIAIERIAGSFCLYIKKINGEILCNYITCIKYEEDCWEIECEDGIYIEMGLNHNISFVQHQQIVDDFYFDTILLNDFLLTLSKFFITSFNIHVDEYIHNNFMWSYSKKTHRIILLCGIEIFTFSIDEIFSGNSLGKIMNSDIHLKKIIWFETHNKISSFSLELKPNYCRIYDIEKEFDDLNNALTNNFNTLFNQWLKFNKKEN